MLTEKFNYELPKELIAAYPLADRCSSRMLILDPSLPLNSNTTDGKIADILSQLSANDLLIVNSSKVLKARLFANKETGGRAEILLERVIGDNQALAHIGASKSPKAGCRLKIQGGLEIIVLGRSPEHHNLFLIQFPQGQVIFDLLERYGHIPLPPYMQREVMDSDVERYQTVYADKLGSVAAPTAGLHFDEELLKKIAAKGVKIGKITLHVGAGTFLPVKSDIVEHHKMHMEYIDVSNELCQKITECRQAGGKIVAVGTTVVRALESAAQQTKPKSGESIQSYQGMTDIFIYPGFKFHVVDSLLTNFHLPESSLLMLVSAFAGKGNIDQAYQQAIEWRYRFFSYGDAMFIKSRI